LYKHLLLRLEFQLLLDLKT